MTLRLRLVGALVVLVAVGLAVFGVATYTLYSRSQYRQLDQQLEAATPSVTAQMVQQVSGSGYGGLSGPAPGSSVAGGGGGPEGGGPGPHGGPGGFFFPGAYGELVGATGTVLAHVQLPNGSSTPLLTRAELRSPGREGRLFTTGSVSGSERWRVYVVPAGFGAGSPGAASSQPAGSGATVAVAVPTQSVESSLHRLVLIELLGALV